MLQRRHGFFFFSHGFRGQRLWRSVVSSIFIMLGVYGLKERQMQQFFLFFNSLSSLPVLFVNCHASQQKSHAFDDFPKVASKVIASGLFPCHATVNPPSDQVQKIRAHAVSVCTRPNFLRTLRTLMADDEQAHLSCNVPTMSHTSHTSSSLPRGSTRI